MNESTGGRRTVRESGRSYVLGVSRTTFAIVTNEKYRAGGGGRHRFITLVKRDLVVLISRWCHPHPRLRHPSLPDRPTMEKQASAQTRFLVIHRYYYVSGSVSGCGF